MKSNTDMLKELVDLCKCNISIEINSHKAYYESIDEGLEKIKMIESDAQSEIDEDLLKEMKEKETIVAFCFSNNPITTYHVYAATIEQALEEMLGHLKDEK